MTQITTPDPKHPYIIPVMEIREDGVWTKGCHPDYGPIEQRLYPKTPEGLFLVGEYHKKTRQPKPWGLRRMRAFVKKMNASTQEIQDNFEKWKSPPPKN